jgi:hypothetical protein
MDTLLVQNIGNNPMAGIWVNGRKVRGRECQGGEEFGIQIKHLDFIQCFSNCIFWNVFLGNIKGVSGQACGADPCFKQSSSAFMCL